MITPPPRFEVDPHAALAARLESPLRRSVRITHAAWRIVRRDRSLVAVAVVAALAGGLAALVRVAVRSARWIPLPAPRLPLAVPLALPVAPMRFVRAYAVVGLTAGAAAALDGHRLGWRGAAEVARRRRAEILTWSARLSYDGPLPADVVERVGLAVLAIEDRPARECLGRGAALAGDRWGHALAGEVGIDAWVRIAAVPAALAVAVGAGEHGLTRIALVLAGVLVLVACWVAHFVAEHVFGLVLYRHALSGEVPAPWRFEDVDLPFELRP